ncbi:MAG: helix-turn-helix domain-containing protein [bacterium]|nr:helix-turn-helix domain-containing protein [bacterium]MCM1374530.1 helix-turn-helix domain-containing protein [Muribaculum sp.]
MFGVARATVSQWKSRGKASKGETVRIIADALGVSADYLLGRTNNPTNYTNFNAATDAKQTIPDLSFLLHLDFFFDFLLRECGNTEAKGR